jgi:MFS family permease
MPDNSSTSQDRTGDFLIPLIWRSPAKTIGEQSRRRITLHLIPYLFFLYILAYLDRVNVSVAQLGMLRPIEEGGMGFDRYIVGFGAGIFFWGYWILEVPSTVSVTRWGARWVFVRILVLWGLCAALAGAIGTPFASTLFSWIPRINEQAGGLASFDNHVDALLGWTVRLFYNDQVRLAILARSASFVNGLNDTPAYQFYFFRFMLGFFEGGFFPSVIVYLSLWFSPQHRARAIASFMAAIPLSNVLGLPISGLLLNVNWLGLPGWRWIFILQGVVPILAGFLTLFFLPDRPHKARWLHDEERDWLLGELAEEHKTRQAHAHLGWMQHAGVVLMLTAVYFCLNVTSYGLQMFMPGIIQSQSNVGASTASVLAALPYLMSLVGMLLNGWHSDRTRERFWHAAVPLTMLGLGVILAALVDGLPVLPVLVLILCVGTFMQAVLPAFWPIPTMFLGATMAAAAIGFINMIGNLGGSVGPVLVGQAAKEQTSFATGLLRIAPWPIVGAGIVLFLGWWHKPRQTNRAK